METGQEDTIVVRRGLLSDYLHRKRSERVGPYVRGRVLDLGCGSATTYSAFKETIDHYVGVDADPGVVERLKKTFPKAEFYVRDLDTDTLYTGSKFDTVLMVAVIEHVYNQRHLFEQINTVLEPGGRLVVTTPSPFGNDVVLRLGSAIGLFHKEKGIDDHKVIYNKQRFGIVAKDFGLVMEKYKRFQFGCNQLVIFRKEHG